MLRFIHHPLIARLLHSTSEKLEAIEICNPEMAKLFCQFIPSHCPFEHDVRCFGQTLFHIPPLCKLNPLYDSMMGLRFKALSYLADVCDKDVTPFCQ